MWGKKTDLHKFYILQNILLKKNQMEQTRASQPTILITIYNAVL